MMIRRIEEREYRELIEHKEGKSVKEQHTAEIALRHMEVSQNEKPKRNYQ